MRSDRPAKGATSTPAALDRRSALRLGALLGGGMLLGPGALAACDSSGEKASPAVSPAPGMSTSAATPPVTSPDQALARLTAGNARFVAGTARHPNQTAERRAGLAAGQHPFAQVLSCVDSRVPPELLFDEGLGDLFVTRTAGQVIDHAVRGSIEYGVVELKIPLLVVLGHEKCGAVKATLEAVEKKSAPLGNDIDALVTGIRPAVEKAENEHATDVLDAAVRHNVANGVAALSRNKTLASAVRGGALRIVGARYDLDTGAVEFL